MEKTKTVNMDQSMPAMGTAYDSSNIDDSFFPDKEKESNIKPFSYSGEWMSTPTIKWQKKDPDGYKVVRKVVKVYNLSESDNLDEYNRYMNESLDEKSTINNFKTIQLNFVESTGAYMALVMYDVIAFKNKLS